MGRHRKYTTNAERQAAYRARKRTGEAQVAEQEAHSLKVAGSSPAPGTILDKILGKSRDPQT